MICNGFGEFRESGLCFLRGARTLYPSIDKNLDKKQFEDDKTTCAIAASTADTDGNDLANISAASVGAAAGAASLPATAAAAAGPIAILSVGIVYGIQKVASRNNAAPIKALMLESCLQEKGYQVQIKQIYKKR